eukprot:279166_1
MSKLETKRRFARYQYIAWNILTLIMLYILPDSLINEYLFCSIKYKLCGYFNTIFHSIQLIAFIAFFISHFSNPGKLQQDMTYPSNSGLLSLCNICNLRQPLNSKHCKICNACVEKFDHHCDITANCIGKNNHAYYNIFIFTQFIAVFMAFYISFCNLFGHDYFNTNINNDTEMNILYQYFRYTPLYFVPLLWIEFMKIIACTFNLNFTKYILDCSVLPQRHIWDWCCRIALFTGLLLPLILLFGLSIWHFYLMVINKTTYQLLKGNKKRIKTDASDAV